jgi:hypothetical protein
MMGTSHERSGASATTWVVRSLVIVVTATLIVAVRRSRSRDREHTGPATASPMAPSPTPTSRTAHSETDSPEPDVLDQRQAAWPEPVDDLPTEIPPEQPEADVLEQWREVPGDEEPQVVDEPPRDR